MYFVNMPIAINMLTWSQNNICDTHKDKHIHDCVLLMRPYHGFTSNDFIFNE